MILKKIIDEIFILRTF